jgi:hypothetical protein
LHAADAVGITTVLCEHWDVSKTAKDAVMSLFLQLFERPENTHQA